MEKTELEKLKESGAKFAYPLPGGEWLGFRLPSRDEAEKYTDARLSGSAHPSHTFQVYVLGCMVYPDQAAGKALLERYSGASKTIVGEINERAGFGEKAIPLDSVRDESVREQLKALIAVHGELAIYQKKDDVLACRKPTRLEMQAYTDGLLTDKITYAAGRNLVTTTRVYPSPDAAEAILDRWAMLHRSVVDGVHQIAGSYAAMVDIEGN